MPSAAGATLAPLIGPLWDPLHPRALAGRLVPQKRPENNMLDSSGV
jgi:hypothetical protein